MPVFSEHWCEGFFTETANPLPAVAIVKFLGQSGFFNRNVKSYFVKDTSRQTEDKISPGGSDKPEKAKVSCGWREELEAGLFQEADSPGVGSSLLEFILSLLEKSDHIPTIHRDQLRK